MISASGPTSFRNSSSSRILTPSSVAFLSLEPASSPTTTKSVFFETLPETVPPISRMMSPASSRDSDESLPVSTNVFPRDSRMCSSRARHFGHCTPSCDQLVDDPGIPRFGQERVYVRRRDRADIRHFFDLRGRRAAQSLKRTGSAAPAHLPSPRRRRGSRVRTGIVAASSTCCARAPRTSLAADFSPMRSSSARLRTPRR